MNQFLEIAGAVGAGGIFTVLAAYFAFSGAFRDYIREAVGKVPEVAATVTQAQRMATFEELAQLRAEFERHQRDMAAKMEKLSDDAVEGRRRLHADIREGFDGIHDKVNELALDLTNKVAELRGELKGLK